MLKIQFLSKSRISARNRIRPCGIADNVSEILTFIKIEFHQAERGEKCPLNTLPYYYDRTTKVFTPPSFWHPHPEEIGYHSLIT